MKTLTYWLSRFAPNWLLNLHLSTSHTPNEKIRIAAFEDWKRCARWLMEATKNAHAKEIFAFIDEGMFPARPIAGGFRPLRMQPTRIMPVVVLLPFDADVGGIWQKAFDLTDNCAAKHITDVSGMFSVITLKNQFELGDLAKGILFLHEAMHALCFYERPVGEKRSQHDKDKEELEIIEFECRLLEQYLGADFTSLVEREVERIKKLVRPKKGSLKIEEKWFHGSTAKLSVLTGEFVSGTEQDLFYTILMHHTIFRFVEKYLPATEREAAKIGFIAHIDHANRAKQL